jgi:hypothetical protein
MHHVCAMRSIQRVGDLPAVLQHLAGRQRSLLDPIGERFAVEQLHDQEGGALFVTDVVQHADVRVIEG